MVRFNPQPPWSVQERDVSIDTKFQRHPANDVEDDALIMNLIVIPFRHM